MNLSKTNYTITDKFTSLYTGGKIQPINKDTFVCLCNGTLKVDTDSKNIVTFEEDDDQITQFSVSQDKLITSHVSLFLRFWDFKTAKIIKILKSGHRGTIRSLEFHPTSPHVVSAGDDHVVKIWHAEQHYCTHNLKGHVAPITICRFWCAQLFSVSTDGQIIVWDLNASQQMKQISLHTAPITDCTFFGDFFCSVSNDSTLSAVDVKSLEILKSIATGEEMQSVLACGDQLVTVSEGGSVLTWNIEKSAILSRKKLGDLSISSFQPVGDGFLATTTQNHILVYDCDLVLIKQIPGDCDGVVAVVFVGEKSEHVAVASSTCCDIRLLGIYTGDSRFFSRHKYPLLCARGSPDKKYVITSSKDGMVVVWHFEEDNKTLTVQHISTGNITPVTVLGFSHFGTFILTGSDDNQVMLFPLKKQNLSCQRMVQSHSKTMTDLVVSPNDQFFATSSRDKQIKLWSVDSFDLLSVLKGHRKAVMCLSFCPTEKILASGSTDGAILMWSLTSYSVLKTLEGNHGSVLRVQFISRGSQLMSSCSDGLVRLWSVRSCECVKTLEDHKERVFSLDFSADESRFVSAGANSVIYLWRDTTRDDRLKEGMDNLELLTKRQKLENFVQLEQWVDAIPLAVELERPKTLLTIIRKFFALYGVDGCVGRLKDSFVTFSPEMIERLLGYCVGWDENTRTCFESQMCLSAVFRGWGPERLLSDVVNIHSILEGLGGFQDRHLERICGLSEQAGFLDFVFANFVGLRVDECGDVNFVESVRSCGPPPAKKIKVDDIVEKPFDLGELIRNSVDS